MVAKETARKLVNHYLSDYVPCQPKVVSLQIKILIWVIFDTFRSKKLWGQAQVKNKIR